MTIRDLYSKYQIMPQLVTHMLRVAGVAKIIAEHWKDGCDVKQITNLCLLHDMGNIVKFDLSEGVDRQKFGEIESLPHWRQIQKEYLNKYGKSAYDATTGILAEAKLEKYIPYISEEKKLYFTEARESELSHASIPSIILMYSDCRVKPSGVVSYRERIDDLKSRYGGVRTDTWNEWTYFFEIWMQSKVNIQLSEITEKSVEPLFDELLTYTI